MSSNEIVCNFLEFRKNGLFCIDFNGKNICNLGLKSEIVMKLISVCCGNCCEFMNCQLDNFIKLSEFFNSIFFCDNENKLYFKKNKKNLLHIKWYKNGCIKIKCYYKNGKKDGKFQRWLKNGYLVEESDWKDDIKI